MVDNHSLDARIKSTKKGIEFPVLDLFPAMSQDYQKRLLGNGGANKKGAREIMQVPETRHTESRKRSVSLLQSAIASKRANTQAA